MKYYISIILFTVSLLSCNRHSEYWDRIVLAESLIYEKPDSAMAVLNQINTKDLIDKHEIAAYSLYLTMALEEAGERQVNFDIFQPALDFYTNSTEGEKTSSSTEKMRGRYYAGRIHQVKNDTLAAMQYYCNALYKGVDSDDILTKARIHYSQGEIYSYIHEWDRSIVCNQKAAQLFRELNRTNDYARCLINSIICFGHKKDSINAEKYIERCKELLPIINADLQSDFYVAQLKCILNYDNAAMIKEYLDEYFLHVPMSRYNWLLIAETYCRIKDFDKAQSAISNYKGHSATNEEKATYHLIVSELYKNKGDYDKALYEIEQYKHTINGIYSSIISQDTKIVETIVSNTGIFLKHLANRETVVYIAILLLLVVLLLFRTIYKKNKIQRRLVEQEMETYKLLYLQMEQERDNLTELLSQNCDLPTNVQKSVAQRLELLNKFFTAYITNNNEIDRKANMELEELLANKDAFMISTRLAFSGSHPNFIKYLEERNLTEWEINYCCLYALGLKGKEVGSYIKMRSHYNNSIEIRKKLEINEHETNLGIYIRKLLKSLE